jgi:hypothetical protein
MLGLGLSLNSSVQESSVSRLPSYSNSHNIFVDGTEAVGILDSTDITSIFGGNYTYSFWVYDTAYNTSYACGTKKSTTPTYEIGVRFLNLGVMYLQVFHEADGTGGSAFYNVGSSLTNSNWHQITVTCTAGATGSDNATIKTYLNGSLVGTNTSGPTKDKQDAFAATSGSLFGVGARYSDLNSPTFHTSSYFDEFAFWSAVLDADAVSAIYNSGDSIDLSVDSGDYDRSSDLESWYRFNNDFTDSQGNSTTGTAVGDPLFGSSDNPPGTP